MAKISKKNKKKINKYLKKVPLASKVMAVVLFLLATIGSFGITYILQRNDHFELIGPKVVTMNVGGIYQEPNIDKAIECISFGRNSIGSVSINQEETTYNSSSSLKEGTYYIVYQTSDFKYSSITRIRTIIVNEIEINEDGLGE